jgi:RNA polymerase sigma factor (sigma-70 family)
MRRDAGRRPVPRAGLGEKIGVLPDAAARARSYRDEHMPTPSRRMAGDRHDRARATRRGRHHDRPRETDPHDRRHGGVSARLATPALPPTATRSGVERLLEQHRPELTAYCRRLLGSHFDAEDAVQDTLVRAWRGLDGLERRARLRPWLYRIATNVCRDMLRARAGLQPVAAEDEPAPAEDDPAELAAVRETVLLAFAATLRHLTPRQRAALILCEVLRWRASEVAALLGTTVAAVTSALQRARAAIAATDLRAEGDPPLDPVERRLLNRYATAFERDDVDRLVALIHEDVALSGAGGALAGAA